MTVFWTKTAKDSFEEELDFIHIKWGNKEVDRFINLSVEFINLLAKGLIEGKPSKKRNIRISVISKQSTLIYKINTVKNRIELVLFWNNLKDPNKLEKVLTKH